MPNSGSVITAMSNRPHSPVRPMSSSASMGSMTSLPFRVPNCSFLANKASFKMEQSGGRTSKVEMSMTRPRMHQMGTMTLLYNTSPKSKRKSNYSKVKRNAQALVNEIEATISKLQPKDLAAVFSKYTRGDSDSVNVSAFVKVMEEFGIRDADVSTRVFKLFDKDNSGSIDYKEFYIGVQALSSKTSTTLEDRLKVMFDIYDLDGDGGLSKFELYKMLMAGSLKTAQKSSIIQIVSMIFEVCDEDRSGKVTLEEFIEGAAKDSSVNSFCRKYFMGGSKA